MIKKEFPVRGHCLSTDPIIVNYLKDNFERFLDNKYSKRSTGVAWNENKWWYISRKSSTPEYSPLVIINIITKINEMNNPTTTTTLSTTSGVMSGNANYDIVTTTGTLPTLSGVISDNTTCTITITDTITAAPIYNPNNIWVNVPDVSTGIIKNLVTEPTKLRIKCRNLKKNLKVSLLQINLK
jgi:hypothetical protein